jgi:hypothetical protein
MMFGNYRERISKKETFWNTLLEHESKRYLYEERLIEQIKSVMAHTGTY